MLTKTEEEAKGTADRDRVAWVVSLVSKLSVKVLAGTPPSGRVCDESIYEVLDRILKKQRKMVQPPRGVLGVQSHYDRRPEGESGRGGSRSPERELNGKGPDGSLELPWKVTACPL